MKKKKISTKIFVGFKFNWPQKNAKVCHMKSTANPEKKHTPARN